MTDLLRDQRGSAMVTAILVTLLVLTLGFSALATVDVQQGQSRQQRERESTFQLSEAVLSAQIFQLSRRWPGTQAAAYPANCTPDSATNSDCPAPAALSSAYAGTDYQQLSWTTSVRDNGGGAAQYYDGAVVELQPAWDQNGDNLVWVRAQSKLVDPANAARFKPRVLVALVKAESVPLTFPKATLVADHFQTTNQGNKTIIDTNGLSAEWLAGPIYVRCQAPGYTSTATCAQYDNSKQRAQVDPDTVDYTQALTLPGISDDRLGLLRARAVAEGNYYASGCAPSLAGDNPGEVVFMEAANVPCKYMANTVYNSEASPGVVVIASGSLLLAGTSEFHGLIYHANVGDSNGTLVELDGNTSVIGSIQVAGAGGIYAGSSKVNLVYNPNYIDAVEAFGTAGIVQNSFRELAAAG